MMRTLMTKTTIRKKIQTTCLQQATSHRPATPMTGISRRATRVTSRPVELTMRRQVVMVPVLVLSLTMVRERMKRRMAQLWTHNYRRHLQRQRQPPLLLRLARRSRANRRRNQSSVTEPDGG